jgi:hypothetical protein
MSEPVTLPPLPTDCFAVNFMRLAGLDKHKARECETIARQVLAAAIRAVEAPAEPSQQG